MKMNSSQIKQQLETLLHGVQKPGSYIGGEVNQILKEKKDVKASIVFAFPDSYEIGMSHNGTRVLYHVVNRYSHFSAERCFAPLKDMAEAMKNAKIPLYSLETYTPLSEFDCIGISLQTELNYTNVPYLLELGGVPAFSKDRKGDEPFVVGGGPCMANPEPVCDFFDFFVIGDGEEIVIQILEMIAKLKSNSTSRLDILKELSKVKGIYVPSLWKTIKNEFGEQIPSQEYSKGAYLKTKGVQRVWLETLDPKNYPVANLAANTRVVHERFSVEVMRGCTQGCRFCQAGYWYRPNRELDAKEVLALSKEGLKQTGERELGLLSLSTADYGQVESVTDEMIRDEYFKDVNLSLPSLRANSFGQSLATKVNILGGGRSATFAPETGSERLRKIINKTISDKDMYEAARSVFQNGFSNIKLYTMVGLPTEDLNDMEAFCGLIQGLVDIAREYNPSFTVHPNIGILVPKPVTPMQWIGFMSKEKVMEHIYFVRNRFRYCKNVRITWADWDTAAVEAFYSRGDRNLSSMIYRQYQKGKTFESYSENLDYVEWQETWQEFNYSPERIYQVREEQDIFPWDIIHAGVNKAYLKFEYRKMLDEIKNATPVPDCKWGDCQRCGIPGNYEDIQLSTPLKEDSKPYEVNELKEIHKQHKQRREDQQSWSYLIVYTKESLSKYLQHQSILTYFEKAFRRLEIPMTMTQGFHPRPILRNSGALPLGLESHCELLMVYLNQDIKTEGFSDQISKFLPDGINVLHLSQIQQKKFPKIMSMSYLLEGSHLKDSFSSSSKFGKVKSHRGKEYDLDQEILQVNQSEKGVGIKTKVNESGGSINPYLMFQNLLGYELDELKKMKLVKSEVEYQF